MKNSLKISFRFQNQSDGCGLDIALQEMISHATSRVNQYTDECNR